jgi:hypothetical protein
MKKFKRSQYFQPATLPQALVQLQEALANANNESSRREAALDIIHQYYSHFGPAGMRAEMWKLLAGALGNKPRKKDRHGQNLFFFYEFTLMLMDAGWVVNEMTRGS